MYTNWIHGALTYTNFRDHRMQTDMMLSNYTSNSKTASKLIGDVEGRGTAARSDIIRGES